jgi:hypothetical protein
MVRGAQALRLISRACRVTAQASTSAPLAAQDAAGSALSRRWFSSGMTSIAAGAWRRSSRAWGARG